MWLTGYLKRLRGGEGGFSLIEQVIALALVAIVVSAVMQALSTTVRGVAAADTRVTMLNLARSQLESVKQQPYQDLPATYTIIKPVPKEYTISVTASAVKTYAYPEPEPKATLPDELQLITVEVSYPGGLPPVGPLILKGYKVRR